MNRPTYEQARSLLQRWGYKAVTWNITPDGSVIGDFAQRMNRRFPDCIWSRTNEELLLAPADAPDFSSRLDDLIEALAELHSLDPSDIRRVMLAEPGQIRDLGAIEVISQEVDPDYQGKVPHTPAKLKMDKRGRDRLIAALIEGCDQIHVYDEKGMGYSLSMEVLIYK